MKRVFAFSFFILGFSSLISQVVLVRELMISFYGNEFFIGWILFSWLLWTGVGSLLGEKLFRELLTVYRASMACHFLTAVSFPATLVAVRASRLVLHTAAGQVPNILPALILSFLVMAPLCLVFGLQFVAGTRNTIFRHDEIESGVLIGRSYLAETLGFVAGGILFSYSFVFSNEFFVAAAVAFVNLAAMSGLLYARPSLKRNAALTLIVLTLIFSVTLLLKADGLNFRTTALRYPSQTLVSSINSVHGNITVTRTRNQHNFYQNGLFVGSDDEQVANEYLVHFPMLAHPNPKRVLLIGTGYNGALREILKHHPDQVAYLEVDDTLIRLAHQYGPVYLDSFLEDRRVRIFYDDSRRFLKQNADPYDVILVNVPNPSTALLNRCYTDEFYASLKAHLRPGGIVAARLDFSPNFLPRQLNDLAACVSRTLQRSFSSVLLLPEDTLYFIASPEPGWAVTPEILTERLRSRGIENYFVVPSYIQYRMTNDRVAQVREALKHNYGAKTNYDFQPRGTYYNLVYWLSVFYSKLSGAFAAAGWVPFRTVFGSILLVVALPLVLFLGSPRRKKTVCFVAMSVGGFSLMAAEVLVIYSFQVFYGNLYYKIAWIIACFMAGMGLGALWGSQRRHKFSTLSLFYIHFWTAVVFLAWLGLVRYGHDRLLVTPEMVQTVYLALAVAIGGLIGFEFPIANKLYFRGESNLQQKTGSIYTADLIGSGFGALSVSVFLLPLYGIEKTLILLCAVNLVASLLFFLIKNLGRKYR
ncbi:MAG: hypothetical protein WC352_03355 [Candidatus Omnitrophota bacterium]|jgi:spermidine synthase